MKKAKVCISIFLIMLLVAIFFIIYAAFNPQAFFPLPLVVVRSFYLVYVVIMLAMLVASIVFKVKSK